MPKNAENTVVTDRTVAGAALAGGAPSTSAIRGALISPRPGWIAVAAVAAVATVATVAAVAAVAAPAAG